MSNATTNHLSRPLGGRDTRVVRQRPLQTRRDAGCARPSIPELRDRTFRGGHKGGGLGSSRGDSSSGETPPSWTLPTLYCVGLGAKAGDELATGVLGSVSLGQSCSTPRSCTPNYRLYCHYTTTAHATSRTRIKHSVFQFPFFSITRSQRVPR